MEPIKTTEVTVSRTIAATPAQVYAVWLDPTSPGSPWFGTARAIVNAAVDGLFYHSVEHAGRAWAHYGRFIALDHPRRIQHTWMSEATRGLESVVTVTLEAAGAGASEQVPLGCTAVTLHHANIPDDPMGRQHVEGWGFVLSAIADRFARS
jgi:uncharacterized protein YndB with AHSA1/START domain